MWSVRSRGLRKTIMAKLKPIRSIRTLRLLLYPADESVIEAWLQHPREAEIVNMYGGDAREMEAKTPEEGQRWFANLLKTRYAWMICWLGNAIGIVKSTRCMESESSIFLSLGLFSERYFGQGFGTEVVNAVTTFCFSELNLSTVRLEVLDYIGA